MLRKQNLGMLLAIMLATATPLPAVTATAQQLKAQAGQAYSGRSYQQAGQLYEQALQIERNDPGTPKGTLANTAYWAGSAYRQADQHRQAIPLLNAAAGYYRTVQDWSSVVDVENAKALSYEALGDLRSAVFTYNNAYLTARDLLKDNGTLGFMANNLGLAYVRWGRFASGAHFLREALRLTPANAVASRATVNLNIGLAYRGWKHFDRAAAFFDEAMRGFDPDKDWEARLTVARDAALSYITVGEAEKAVRFLEDSIARLRNFGKYNRGLMALLQSESALAYLKLNQRDKAQAAYKNYQTEMTAAGPQALPNLGRAAVPIAEAELAMGNSAKAISMYGDFLALARKEQNTALAADMLAELGRVYRKNGQYAQAIPMLQEAVMQVEHSRAQADPETRRDLIANQISIYQALIDCYIATKQDSGAYKAMELGKSKTLLENISIKYSALAELLNRGFLHNADHDESVFRTETEAKVEIPPLASVQKGLNADTVVLCFANADTDRIGHLAITNTNLSTARTAVAPVIQTISAANAPAISAANIPSRGVRVVKKDGASPTATLEGFINYYRSLLSSPDPANVAKGKQAGAALYRLLIQPMANAIKGKRHLVIVPDGPLAFIPFETLVDAKGHYLVENFHISYAHSLAVQARLKQRRYPDSRQPMLAFGGAVYERNANQAQDELHISDLRDITSQALASRGSLAPTYDRLGIGNWQNLPGTLQEVKQIGGTIKGARVITGADVAEAKLKAMAAAGELAKYKVLHFATHGLVVPEAPELSALVLSQPGAPSAQEDGYLRMEEIANLKTEADFINLSACETGLGRIVGGEGVLGLTYAFVSAGANGVSASLWPVADASTSQFMANLYASAQKDKRGHSDAITETKRRFLKGDFGSAFKAPYFWAPFVYYGV